MLSMHGDKGASFYPIELDGAVENRAVEDHIRLLVDINEKKQNKRRDIQVWQNTHFIILLYICTRM